MKNVFFLATLFLATLNSKILNAIDKLDMHDIFEIYTTHVQPNMNNAERHRYITLPMSKNTKSWPWEDKDLPRVIANLEFERFVVSQNLNQCKKGLAINGLDPEWIYIDAQEIVQIDYLEDQNKYDLHTLDLPEKNYDYVLCCQTIEHLYDPIRCLKNIYDHMAPGGILYLNAPSDTIPHDTPVHFYTGFTSTGIGAMLRLAGFRILKLGQWGNPDYLATMHKTNSWPDYRQFKSPKINDFSCTPAIVWAFACK